MGTQTTQELQEIIKQLCGRVGWSQKRLAREIFYELNDVDDDAEMQRFEESLKKALTRPKTKPELLQYYLDVMRAIPAIQKADLIVPQYVSTNLLDPELEKAMTLVSKKITKEI